MESKKHDVIAPKKELKKRGEKQKKKC